MQQLELYEFGEAKQLPDGIQPEALKRYLHQIWQNRQGVYRNTENDLSLWNGKQPFFEFDGPYIQAQNYAGIIHFQGVTFYIFPKIFKSLPPSADNKKPAIPALVRHLSFYLSYCSNIQFPFQWQAIETTPSDTIHQWIHYFASYAAATLTQQPYQIYQTQTQETEYLRGKLAVQPYLNQQLSRGQWQRLHTEQQPFEFNNTFNQIVKYTATRLLTIAEAPTQNLLQDVLWVLAEVDLVPCTVTDCDAVHINRLYPKHQEILDMCRFFLAGESSGESASQAMNFAFLVPMERIFEGFVAGFIQKHFPEWQAQFQKAVPLGVSNHNRIVLARPDIWLPFQHTVWDTKYKSQTADHWSAVASSDLYQALAYASVYQIDNVHLLYASSVGKAFEIIRCGTENDPVFVHIHALPIVLTHSADTFSALTLRLKETLQKIAIS